MAEEVMLLPGVETPTMSERPPRSKRCGAQIPLLGQACQEERLGEGEGGWCVWREQAAGPGSP